MAHTPFHPTLLTAEAFETVVQELLGWEASDIAIFRAHTDDAPRSQAAWITALVVYAVSAKLPQYLLPAPIFAEELQAAGFSEQEQEAFFFKAGLVPRTQEAWQRIVYRWYNEELPSALEKPLPASLFAALLREKYNWSTSLLSDFTTVVGTALRTESEWYAAASSFRQLVGPFIPLHSELTAGQYHLLDDFTRELEAQGLPQGTSLADLLRHVRGNAALAASFEALIVHEAEKRSQSRSTGGSSE